MRVHFSGKYLARRLAAALVAGGLALLAAHFDPMGKSALGAAFVVYTLLPNTTYNFRIQAYNAAGVTDYSWQVLGSTKTSSGTASYKTIVGSAQVLAVENPAGGGLCDVRFGGHLAAAGLGACFRQEGSAGRRGRLDLGR